MIKTKMGAVRLVTLLTLVFLAALPAAAVAHVPDDDYPYKNAAPYNVAQYEWWVDENGNGVVDLAGNDEELRSPYGFYYRNCTDFVAFRLATRNGFTFPSGFGNVGSWGDTARAKGYVVNTVPARGAVALWTGSPGHVAWVDGVNGDGTVTYEEYNSNRVGAYSHDTRPAGFPTGGYIHFKDIPASRPAEPGSPRTVSTGSNWAKVAWVDRSDNESDFRVRYRIGSASWTEVAAVPSGSTGTAVTGLRPLTDYTLQVGARNSLGTKWSAYFYGRTKEPLPAQPLNPRPAVREQRSIVLAWDDVSNNERGFSVQYRIAGGAWTVLSHVAPRNAESYAMTGLTPGKQYTFQVGAWSTGGTKWSTYAYISTKPTLPAQPASPRVGATTTNSASLAWADVATNESHYRIQYKIGNGAWTQVSPWLGADSTSFTVTGLAANTSYTFQVGARNETGTKWSEYCYGRTQQPPSLPAQPLNPKCASTTSNSAYITWTDASNNETDFRVQYRIGSGAWIQASTTAPANATSMTVAGLSPSTDYTFQVGARNSAGTKWAAYASGRTQAAVNPTYLRKILRLSDGSAWLITAKGTRAWIPTGGDYQAMVNNGVPVVNTDWATIAQYPASGYYAVVNRMDDPAIGGPTNWIIYKSGNGAGWENDYYLTQSAAGKSYTTNWATWTLSNGRGLVRVNAYIPTLDAVAGVVYHVYDGSTYLGSVSVNQKTSYGFIQLGTWDFKSGTIVVRVNDNEGAGPYGAYIGFDCIEGIPVG